MKIKKKSIIIPAFALLIGASLAGSVTGTVAWYQFSTRTQAAYVGTSGGTSGNLPMRLKRVQDAKWPTRLTKNDINTYLANAGFGSKIAPVTPGALDKDAALPENFYSNPVTGRGPYEQWVKASKDNYVQIPLELRYIERDGVLKEVNGKKIDDEEIEQDVYLTDLLIQEDHKNADDRGDLSDAIRFHVQSFQADSADVDPATGDGKVDGSEINRLISKNGGTTLAQAKLDLDGDGKVDSAYLNGDKFGFNDDDPNNTTAEEIIYGRSYPYKDDQGQPVGEDSIQTSYHAKDFNVVEKDGQVYYDEDLAIAEPENIYPLLVKTNDQDLDLAALSYDDEDGNEVSKSLGKTIAKDPAAANDDYLNVVITIWVEGWQKFAEPVLDDQGQEVGQKVSSIWDTKFINSMFDVGFEFGVDSDPLTK